MYRYVISLMVAVAAVGMLLLVSVFGDYEDPAFQFSISSIEWSVISLFSLLALLSVWGMIGIALSKLRERAKAFAVQEVKISKKSWHYRLNKRVNFGIEPSKIRSECEYWACLFNGLYTFTPFLAILLFVPVVINIVSWFSGCRPIWSPKSGYVEFKPGRQRSGPILFGLLLIGGLAASLLLSGTGQDASHVSWMTVGKWAGIGTGGVIAAAVSLFVLYFIYKAILHAVRPIFSAFGARVIGVCRPTSYTD